MEACVGVKCVWTRQVFWGIWITGCQAEGQAVSALSPLPLIGMFWGKSFIIKTTLDQCSQDFLCYSTLCSKNHWEHHKTLKHKLTHVIMCLFPTNIASFSVKPELVLMNLVFCVKLMTSTCWAHGQLSWKPQKAKIINFSIWAFWFSQRTWAIPTVLLCAVAHRLEITASDICVWSAVLIRFLRLLQHAQLEFPQ